jgi:hypothetical protein
MMQTLSPWATKVEVDEPKADTDALHAALAAMHRDLRAIHSEQQADMVVAPAPPAALSV